jgi:K+-transporting ATPase ATPase A chain
MNSSSLAQIGLLILSVTVTAAPFGRWLGHIFGEAGHNRGRLVRLVCRLCAVDPDKEQNWRDFAYSALCFNAVGVLASYALMRCQHLLPFNPAGLPAVPPDLAFNTAASFSVNADWQAYGGETTMSYFSQMAALTVQNFTCAASGIAVLAAFIRGLSRQKTATVGNFYVDVIRAILSVMLPLAVFFTLFLVWQGVPQNLDPATNAATLDGGMRQIAQGPVASQDAMKLLGTNGGGFFNANSAHPYESPNPLVNFLQCWAMLFIPASLVFAFGRMIGDRRQGRALFSAMTFLLLGGLLLGTWVESRGNPLMLSLPVDMAASEEASGGNMEGKEVRFGPSGSALFEMVTTATGTGAANASLDSFTPVGGMVAMLNLMTKEVIFGGVGAGLHGMLVEVFIAVFLAGLMVGRSPEYAGKRIGIGEMKLVVVMTLLPTMTVLALGALSVVLPAGSVSITAAGPHGLSQALYAYLSTTVNNGSAFGGFTANTLYQNSMLGLALLVGRFLVMVPTLALAGRLAAMPHHPESPGTLPTHGIFFMMFLIATIVLVGSLTFFPVLALGPIAEYFLLEAGISF